MPRYKRIEKNPTPANRLAKLALELAAAPRPRTEEPERTPRTNNVTNTAFLRAHCLTVAGSPQLF